jgi:hypothetical protein
MWIQLQDRVVCHLQPSSHPNPLGLRLAEENDAQNDAIG